MLVNKKVRLGRRTFTTIQVIKLIHSWILVCYEIAPPPNVGVKEIFSRLPEQWLPNIAFGSHAFQIYFNVVGLLRKLTLRDEHLYYT